MLRKTLFTLTAIAILGVGSAAMAHSGGGRAVVVAAGAAGAAAVGEAVTP